MYNNETMRKIGAIIVWEGIGKTELEYRTW
jgi:hypothetical protein